jgi:sirohydrochlorin cobaltochelatase
VLAHGSRRAEANQPITALSEALGATPAYWAVSPDLASQLQRFSPSQRLRIGILTYFLLEGGITDAIATAVEQLSPQHPHLQLILLPPLNAYAELIDVLLNWVIDSLLPNSAAVRP